MQEDIRRRLEPTQPIEPRGTWEGAWRAMEEKRLIDLPDFSGLPQSGYSVSDGSSGVVEVYAAGKYRTYMYPNSWAFDNVECREFEALIAAFSQEFLGGNGKTPARSFLSVTEIKRLSAHLGGLSYPMPAADFFGALPVRLAERGLRASGISGDGVQRWWSECPLTNRADPQGYYHLKVHLATASWADNKGENLVQRAEIVFINWGKGEERIVNAADFSSQPETSAK